MILELGANTVVVTLNELTTITSPEYICIFVNDATKLKVACKLGTDLSDYPTRYNKFTITVKTSPVALNSEVHLPNEKGHRYYIYETADASTFDYANVDDLDLDTMSGLVEQGKMSYISEATDPAYYKNLSSSQKTFNE